MSTSEPGVPDRMVVPAPAADGDSQFYWDGLRARRLLVQRCNHCGRHRFPPMPGCPTCAWPTSDVVEVEPRATIYSWIVVHRALTPAFQDEVPYVVAVVELAEGCRLLARLDHQEPIEVGQTAVGRYVDHASWTELRFRVGS
jgi:uncharacterized protein